MKRLLLLFAVVLTTCISYAQNNSFAVDDTYYPMTMEEIMLPILVYSQNSERIQQIQEQRLKAAKQVFKEYKDKAYECFNSNNYSWFLYYSAIAINTGWYTDNTYENMYFDRGIAFEALHDYKQAKKEYKMAIQCGYYPALHAYKQVKMHKREWTKEQKGK